MACLWILSVFARGYEVLGSGSYVSIVEQEREPYSVVPLGQLKYPSLEKFPSDVAFGSLFQQLHNFTTVLCKSIWTLRCGHF